MEVGELIVISLLVNNVTMGGNLSSKTWTFVCPQRSSTAQLRTYFGAYSDLVRLHVVNLDIHLAVSDSLAFPGDDRFDVILTLECILSFSSFRFFVIGWIALRDHTQIAFICWIKVHDLQRCVVRYCALLFFCPVFLIASWNYSCDITQFLVLWLVQSYSAERSLNFILSLWR